MGKLRKFETADEFLKILTNPNAANVFSLFTFFFFLIRRENISEVTFDGSVTVDKRDVSFSSLNCSSSRLEKLQAWLGKLVNVSDKKAMEGQQGRCVFQKLSNFRNARQTLHEQFRMASGIIQT